MKLGRKYVRNLYELGRFMKRKTVCFEIHACDISASHRAWEPTTIELWSWPRRK